MNTNPVEALLSRAQLLMEAGRENDALPLIARARAVDPQSARACCFQSLAHISLEEWASAREAAAAAAYLQPDDEWPHRLMALACRGQGDRYTAVFAAESALRIAPDVPEVLHIAALCQWERGWVRKAERTLARLQQVAPERSETAELLGLVAKARRSWKAAETHFRRAMQFDPNNESALWALGSVLLRRRPAEAMEYFHAAVRLQPNDEVCRDKLRSALASYLFDWVQSVEGVFRAYLIWLAVCFLIAVVWVYLTYVVKVHVFSADLAFQVLACLFVLAFLGAHLLRLARIRNLHPQLAWFYSDARDRERKAWLNSLPLLLVIGYVVLRHFFSAGFQSLDPRANGYAAVLMLIIAVMVSSGLAAKRLLGQ